MHKDIKAYTKSCTICQTHNKSHTVKEGKMAPIYSVRPFQIIGMDIMVNLPITSSGNRSIIVFTDYYTKWVEAFPIPDETTTTVAQKLCQVQKKGNLRSFYLNILGHSKLPKLFPKSMI